MDHEPVLITTIAIGLTAAFIGGFIARRLRLPAIVGYLAGRRRHRPVHAGLRGRPGHRHGAGRARRDPAHVRRRHPLLDPRPAGGQGDRRSRARSARSSWRRSSGIALGVALGWGLGGGLVLGLAVSVASTVVLLRALDGPRRARYARRAASPSAGSSSRTSSRSSSSCCCRRWRRARRHGRRRGDRRVGPLGELAIALGKAAVFAGLMFVAGARVVPWLLHQVAREGSRELFTLAVLAIALGIAYLSVGRVRRVVRARGVPGRRGRRRVGHEPPGRRRTPCRSATRSRSCSSCRSGCSSTRPSCSPTRWPSWPCSRSSSSPSRSRRSPSWPWPATRPGSALTVAAGLAQVGEFSFILGTLGLSLGLLPTEGFQLIVAGALLSITLNPFLFRGHRAARASACAGSGRCAA